MAETVARHLVATGQLIDEDPTEALAHALAARRLAARISAVREAVGLAAYHAGEWQTAIAELRTYHRMTGLQSHLAVLADSERALGRPERAIDLFRGADQEALDPAVATELLIVAAGARGDLGQKDAAVAMLQVRELTTEAVQPWTARLRYAYADALLAVDRRDEAREWFARAAEVDADDETDAAERLLELDGVVIEGDDEEYADEAPADQDDVSTAVDDATTSDDDEEYADEARADREGVSTAGAGGESVADAQVGGDTAASGGVPASGTGPETAVTGVGADAPVSGADLRSAPGSEADGPVDGEPADDAGRPGADQR
ncbi:tetratricopeptide repeat protein [Micromonospora sp. WMMD882]|uniref:tetratricopeptide repeat protein n=1 Tax=Micromonospora sp. WMMD882 TaxID=3015151 RepID=UPI00248C6185|nr:tetratricopeptide repeat protein [Micromonospora sp. WMMD882]WBB81314.1 tetratricopeptide repeat protein [Micromonospora sp. WMMD882]